MISERAIALGKAFEQVATSGRGSHEKWRVGAVQVAVPRHREVNELTAQAILRATEPELGEGWWR
jgi:hypothetical protein